MNHFLMFVLKFGILLVCSYSLSACSHVGAWEKGNLARPEMAFIPDPLEQRLSDHTYFAKEASSSGSAVSGGGCGCN